MIDFDQVDARLNAPERLEAVTEILERRPLPDSVREEIEALAHRLDTPFAAATVLDDRYQHFIATNSGPFESCERDNSHCQYVISTGIPLAINNTQESSLWRRLYRIAVDGVPLQAYLGSPLKYNDQVLGAICVVDFKPRIWTAEDHYQVSETARRVSEILEES